MILASADDGGVVSVDVLVACAALCACATVGGIGSLLDPVIRGLDFDASENAQSRALLNGLCVFNSHKNAGRGKRGTAATAKERALAISNSELENGRRESHQRLVLERRSTWRSTLARVGRYVSCAMLAVIAQAWYLGLHRWAAMVSTCLCIATYSLCTAFWCRTPSISGAPLRGNSLQAPMGFAIVACLVLLGLGVGHSFAALYAAGFHAAALLVTVAGVPCVYADFAYTIITMPIRALVVMPSLQL
jgi:hypothetical protein